MLTVLLMLRGCFITSTTPPRPYSLPFPSSESPLIIVVSRKFERGFQAYEKNTHSRHPLAHNGKRLDSSVGHWPLVDYDDGEYWYGSLSVGTPAKAFTGELSHVTPYVVLGMN